MYKTEVIKVADGEYVIHELKVKEIANLLKIFKNANGQSYIDLAIELIKTFTNIPDDKINELSISDIKLIAGKMFELNKDIVEIPRQLGLGEISDNFLKKMKQQMIQATE